MPAPAILDRFGFAPFNEDGLPHQLVEAVKYARQRATVLLAPLAAKRSAILANKNLSRDGHAEDLKELRRTVGIDIDNTYAHANDRAQAIVDDAQRKFNGRLFLDVEGPEAFKRDALLTARAELFELARDVRRDPNATASAPVLDARTGAAILGSGTAAHKLLHEVISKGQLADARLLTLAFLRSGAIAKHMLGGAAVEQAVIDGLTARVVAEDPAAAEIVATRSLGEHVVRVVRGDKHTATNVLAKATRVPDAAPTKGDTDEA